MAGGKLTRKEIVQQDVIGKTLAETSHWAVRNLKYIAGGILAVLVIVAAVIGWNTFSSSRAEAEQAEFADALAHYHADIGTAPADPANQARASKYRYATREEKYEKALAAFQTVAADYSSSRIGVLSKYYTGLCQYELGRLGESRQTLRELIESTDLADVRNLARNTLAQVAMAEGDTAEAMKSLEAILAEPTKTIPAETVLYRLAEIQEETGDLQGALEKYRKISAEYPGSSSASQATQKIGRLEPRVSDSVVQFQDTAPVEP